MPNKPVALSVGSINLDQRVLQDVLVEHKNDSSTYKFHDYINFNEKVGFCEQVKSDAPLSMFDYTDENVKVQTL